jgi:hypothetical protein
MSRAINLETEYKIILPASLIGRVDISRMLREIEKIDNDLEAQHARAPDQPLAIPAMTKALSELAQLNQLDLLDIDVRQKLLSTFRYTKDKAPNSHITFAVDPEPEIVALLVAWIRQNLHPMALVTVGLQPGLLGGCVVRTPDHIYDFSLKRQFALQLPELIREIKNVTSEAALPGKPVVLNAEVPVKAEA